MPILYAGQGFHQEAPYAYLVPFMKPWCLNAVHALSIAIFLIILLFIVPVLIGHDLATDHSNCCILYQICVAYSSYHESDK